MFGNDDPYHPYNGDLPYCKTCGNPRALGNHRKPLATAWMWLLPAFPIGLFLFIELIKHMYHG